MSPPRNLTRAQFYIPRGLLLGLCLLLICGGLVQAQTRQAGKKRKAKRPTTAAVKPTPPVASTPTPSPPPAPTVSPSPTPPTTLGASQSPPPTIAGATPTPCDIPWYLMQVTLKRDEVQGPVFFVFLVFVVTVVMGFVVKRKVENKMNSIFSTKTWIAILIAVVFLTFFGSWFLAAKGAEVPPEPPLPVPQTPTPTPRTTPTPTPTPPPSGATNAQGQPGGTATNPDSSAAGSTAAGSGPNKVAEGYFLADAVAGQKLAIPGTFVTEGAWHARLTDLQKPEVSPLMLVAAVADKKSLSFSLPNDLPDGRYSLTIEPKGASALLVAGELRIPKPPALQVTVQTVRPRSPYPNPEHEGKYDFEIAGTNFAPTLENNHVEIDGLPIEFGKAPCGKPYKLPCLTTESGSETRKLIVEGYDPPGFSRPLAVSVRVGDGPNVARAPELLVFSSLSKTWLQLAATAAFALLLVIVFALVKAGVKLGKVDGEKYGSLRAFLIDKETNSYSLSKFQLTFFTLVTVFGYIYVFVCRLFVQWKFELPAVPEGLPGMMAVSLGTTVVAAGIGAKIGGKGAGPTSPSPADFITSGGIVLPERFQFFLWTIVSSVGVLVLILAADPVTVTELPKLPDGMLYLMGLSSAGYLGGKLVRGPGPSVKSIDASKVDIPAKPAEGDKPAKPAAKGLEVTITGDNLSPAATFQLDDQRIPSDQAEVVRSTVAGQDPKLCNMLTVQFRDVAKRYFDGEHLFRIINPDTQGADFKYGAKIESVGEVKDGKITVTGTNFKDPSKAGWTPTQGSGAPVEDLGVEPAVDLGIDAVTKKSDTELAITLKAGLTGKGKLTITSPGKLTTRIDVNLGQETPAVTPPTTPGAETSEKESESPLETPSETPLNDATKTDGGEDLPDPTDDDPGA